MILTVALSYSSQQDVAAAARRIARLAAQGLLDPDKVDAGMLQEHLSTAPVLSDVGSPDLLIRTSGEQRLSNFLLFEMAYCELYFSKVHWPDFSIKDLCEAFKDYSKRQRRYGRRLRHTNLI
ncbi:undecaprenyl diphosphate synthase [Dunaliella salina]|nr:undecaprenyl diphosphate synthase [Dunaliella salina]|eukprot:KAF5831218.1 undecaprenyl diphosphate synthase [Dunaliella salina]